MRAPVTAVDVAVIVTVRVVIVRIVTVVTVAVTVTVSVVIIARLFDIDIVDNRTDNCRICFFKLLNNILCRSFFDLSLLDNKYGSVSLSRNMGGINERTERWRIKNYSMGLLTFVFISRTQRFSTLVC